MNEVLPPVSYRLNVSLTACSLAPMYLFSSSGPLILMKLRPISFATTAATSVLPVPGAPYNSTPDCNLIGHWEYSFRYWKTRRSGYQRGGEVEGCYGREKDRGREYGGRKEGRMEGIGREGERGEAERERGKEGGDRKGRREGRG